MSKKARILFIIHDVYQDVNVFPLGIGYLSAVLKQKGHEVDIYCQDIYHYTNKELSEYLEDNSYDVIGIGFLAARFKETIIDLCSVVNRYKKNAWLVLGGHGPSPISEYVLENTDADIVTIGEAEETIIEIVEEKINNTCNLSDIKGISFKNGDKVIINERRRIILDINTIPFPSWDSFPIEDYKKSARILGQKDNEYSLVAMSSRGCINRCNFCYRMEKGFRTRKIGNFVEELKYLNDKYKINNFIFDDEMFVLNEKRLIEFEKKLEEHDLQIRFFCSARVDVINKDIVKILKRCGCAVMSFGLESLDNNVLRLMNKNTTAEQNERAIETVLYNGGISVSLNFLWGSIGDTEESLKQIVSFIKKYNTYQEIRTIRPPTPYPGSDLYYEAIRRGKLKGPKDFFDKFINSDLYLVNFLNMPVSTFYDLLFNANKELILDYYTNTGGNEEECNTMINNFKSLYNGNNRNFRGVRQRKFKYG